MIQAARCAPAEPSRRLLPPSASLQSGGVQPRPRRRLCPEGSGHGRSLSLAPRPAWRARRGPRSVLGLPHRLSRRRRRVSDGLRFAPALGSGRFAPCGGAAWPLAPRNRGLAPTDRGDRTPADQSRGPLRFTPASCAPLSRLHGRRRHRSTAGPVPRCRRRPFRRCALLVPARKQLRLRCASQTLLALRLAFSVPLALHCEREPPLGCASPCAGPSPRREPVAALRAAHEAICLR